MYNVIGELNPYVHMVNNRSTCVLYSQHTDNMDISILVGGLEHFSIDWEFYHPKWRTPSFFRGIPVYHQPAITGNNISQKYSYGIHGLLIWSLVLSLGGVPCCPGSSPGRRCTRIDVHPGSGYGNAANNWRITMFHGEIIKFIIYKSTIFHSKRLNNVKGYTYRSFNFSPPCRLHTETWAT